MCQGLGPKKHYEISEIDRMLGPRILGPEIGPLLNAASLPLRKRRAHSRRSPECSDSYLIGCSGMWCFRMWCFKILILNPSPISALAVKSPHLQFLRVNKPLLSNPTSSNTTSLNSRVGLSLCFHCSLISQIVRNNIRSLFNIIIYNIFCNLWLRTPLIIYSFILLYIFIYLYHYLYSRVGRARSARLAI